MPRSNFASLDLRNQWISPALLGVSAALAVLSMAGCASPGVAGATCTTASECASDLQCLFPIGAGCTSQGYCRIQSNGCLAGAQSLILCGCDKTTLDTSCIDPSAALPERTATGPACATEAGTDSAPE